MSPERQQAIGVRIGVVTRVAGTRLLRTTGRVVPDENRTYPIVAAVSGWIRNVQNVATGDTVERDQVLASFSAPESRVQSAQQSYYTGLEAVYRVAVHSRAAAAVARLGAHGAEAIDRIADELRTLGVSNSQLREMGSAPRARRDIRVESPVDGVVLQRDCRAGLRFDRGFELYRIADSEPRLDSRRRVPPPVAVHPPRRLRADHDAPGPGAVGDGERVGADVRRASADAEGPARGGEPAAGAQARHVRDVEFPVDLPATLVVPADAIVDSGLRKTVFVDRGNGHFEPRLVETGWRIGDDVEVTKGLSPGERIVISGTFFIDSESRMKATAPRCAPPARRRRCVDPVCGMHVDPSAAPQTPAARGARPRRLLLLLGQLPAAVRRRPLTAREAGGRDAVIERIIDFSVRNKFLVLLLWPPPLWPGARCAPSRSTHFPTSATRRSSSTHGGSAARTSSRRRSLIRS